MLVFCDYFGDIQIFFADSRSNKKSQISVAESQENKSESKSSNENLAKKGNQKKNSIEQEVEVFIDKLVEKFTEIPIVGDVSSSYNSGLTGSDLSNILESSSPCNDFNFDDFLKNSDRVVGLLSVSIVYFYLGIVF